MNKEIHCHHYPACSGCSLEKNVDHPPVRKEMVLFFKEQGLDSFPCYSGSPTGWRCRAKLAVRGTSDQPLIGLYQACSHQVMAIPHCQVHHPKINEAVRWIKEFIQEDGIPPYEELHGNGLLRYVQLTVERSTGKIQGVIVLNAPILTKELKNRFEKLKSQIWHSLWLNFNERRDNVIFGEDWCLLHGEPYLREEVLDTPLYFHPAGFEQANLEAFEGLVKNMKKKLSEDTKILELYAGVGAIGLCLAGYCREILCCEINPKAEEAFVLSRSKLSPERAASIQFKTASAASMIALIDEYETVIVDPPRKGLESKLLEALCSTTQRKSLVYVSCGWKAFQRDCRRLLDAGWYLDHAEGHLFFPGTDHIEILAFFNKK